MGIETQDLLSLTQRADQGWRVNMANPCEIPPVTLLLTEWSTPM